MGKDMRQYTKTLRQMAALLSAAAVAASIPEANAANWTLSDASPQVDQRPLVTQSGERSQKRKAKNGAKKPGTGGTTQHNNELATLAKLQSYFRVRNGFTMLQSQMEVGLLSH